MARLTPAHEPSGWSPWAPRSGDGASAPATAPAPRPPLQARAPDVPNAPPTARPWVPPTATAVTGPTGAPLPDRPPLRDPEGLPAGLAPRPPTSWGGPQPTEVRGPASGEDGRPGGRHAALIAGIGALVGALIVGLVFAGYAIGHSSSSSSDDRPRTSGARSSLDVRQILKTVQPSVVSILTGHTTSFYDSAGSGVVISKDGLILTNNHVIDGAQQITVKFSDGSQATAKLVGASPQNDIALVKANENNTVPAKLGSSASVRVGDDVVAIGNALNLGGAPSVTRGIVSAKERALATSTETLDHLIQTDAAINHGNSGGPLINATGEVVGINTAIREDAQSIGFSIAIDSVKVLIKDLKNGKGAAAPDEAFLGVQTVDVSSPDLSQAVKDQFGVTATDGAFITGITPNTAAEDAGLQDGDVIEQIDGNDIATSQDVGDAVATHKPGDRITITVERDGRRRSFDVTLRAH